jgi:hypothetical protein
MLTLRQTIYAALAACSLLVTACEREQSQQNAAEKAANAAQQQAGPTLPLPVPEAPLNREQLLIAAVHAASNFSAGVQSDALQKRLADKKFEFRIRFGCEGPGKPGSEQAFDWTYDVKTSALKVRATPELSPKDAPVKAIAGEAFETVEGFWLRRPWLLSPICPRQPEAAAPDAEEAGTANAQPAKKNATDKSAKPAGTPPSEPATGEMSPHSVGIAQFFTATGPRTMRRSGRPYQTTRRVADGSAPPSQFDLVLTGRLVALPDGRVIACTLAGDGERPACIISVEFGKVSIERADTHEQIAQWGPG